MSQVSREIIFSATNHESGAEEMRTRSQHTAIEIFMRKTLLHIDAMLPYQEDSWAKKDIEQLLDALEIKPHSNNEHSFYSKLKTILSDLLFELKKTDFDYDLTDIISMLEYYYGEQCSYSDDKRYVQIVDCMDEDELVAFSRLRALFLNGISTPPLAGDPEGFLSTFFENSSEDYGYDSFLHRHLTQDERADFLQQPLFYFLAQIYIKNQPLFAYELSLIIHGLPDSEKKAALINQLHLTTVDWSAALHCQHADWYLCSSSEYKLVDSLSDGGFLILTDENDRPAMVVKFNGKEAALVLQNFLTPDGQVVLAGTWICPVSVNCREKLCATFDASIQSAALKDFSGEWAIMRNVRLDNLVKAGSSISLHELRLQLVVNKSKSGVMVDKKGYREKFFEEH